MKNNYLYRALLASSLLLAGIFSLSSCQGFEDAVFGTEDNPIQEQTNSNTPSNSESLKVSQIEEETLNGWDGGFYWNSMYLVYKETGSGLSYYLNNVYREADEGVLFKFDKDGEISNMIHQGKYYSIIENGDDLTLLNLKDGIFEEENLKNKKALTRAPASNPLEFIGSHIPYIDRLLDANALLHQFEDRQWSEFLQQIGEVIVGGYASTLGLAGTVILYPFKVVSIYENQSAERNSAVIYQQCTAEISSINKSSDGRIEIYVTVNNANTVQQYIKRNFSPETVEETRNTVYCGVVGRSIGLPTTQFYTEGYKSNVTEIPTDGSASTLYLTFFLPDVPSGQTYLFRPYLMSTRIKNIFGNVDQGYIRYGESVPYGDSNGIIKALNTTSTTCSTDESGNIFISFNSVATAELSAIYGYGIDEWGIYVDNGTDNHDERYATDNSNLDKGTINVPFNIYKNDFDDIDYNNYVAKKIVKLGVYQHRTDIIDGGYVYSFPQEFELVYDKKPSVTTLECVSTTKTSASVKCKYENTIFWAITCGIEYGYDNNFSNLVLFPTDDNEMIISLTELSTNKEYKYRAYYEINGQTIYGDYKTFTTDKDKNEMISLCPDDNHPHMIDLGLPSGTKWACCNVGASNPEDYGNYYTWGDTETGNYGVDYKYSWENTYGSWTHSNPVNVFIGYEISGTSYDVAKVKMGGSWCLPTSADGEELIENCSSGGETINGHNGLLLVSIKNGNRIFLPAGGYIDVGNTNSTLGKSCAYWLSTAKDNIDLSPANCPSCISSYWRLLTGISWEAAPGRCAGKNVRAISR